MPEQHDAHVRAHGLDTWDMAFARGNMAFCSCLVCRRDDVYTDTDGLSEWLWHYPEHNSVNLVVCPDCRDPERSVTFVGGPGSDPLAGARSIRDRLDRMWAEADARCCQLGLIGIDIQKAPDASGRNSRDMWVDIHLGCTRLD